MKSSKFRFPMKQIPILSFFVATGTFIDFAISLTTGYKKKFEGKKYSLLIKPLLGCQWET